MAAETASEARPKILVVDDDRAFAATLGLLLRPHFEVDVVHDGRTALVRAEAADFDAYLLDIDLGGEIDGLQILRTVRAASPLVPVIMVSRLDQPEMILSAGRLGATDFFGKGDAAELLAHRIHAALQRERRTEALERLIATAHRDFVGDSEPIRRLYLDLESVAPTTSTVLITGESGTGKEVLARLLHERGERRAGAFVPVNCAAVPEGLVESELFGHERGSYTGATAARRGCFELAHDGTLFLDEVTEMPVALQPKLLRVLQSGEYSRLGSERTRRSNARVICATNKDPAAAVGAGTLRQDLYFRINVIHLRIPPLRERRDDIPRLARHFLAIKAAEQGKPVPRLSETAEAVLQGYDWPGNVRELENTMERAVVFCRAHEIGPELLGPIGEGAGYITMAWEEARALALKRFERSYLTLLLRMHRGSVTGAAGAAGLSRQAFYKALERAGLDPDVFRG